MNAPTISSLEGRITRAHDLVRAGKLLEAELLLDAAASELRRERGSVGVHAPLALTGLRRSWYTVKGSAVAHAYMQDAAVSECGLMSLLMRTGHSGPNGEALTRRCKHCQRAVPKIRNSTEAA